MNTNSEAAAAREIFEPIWEKLAASGADSFPKFILWLNGAPGAGKGTHTRFIEKRLGLQSAPVVMSDLLQSPSAKALKDAGKLVGDPEVVSLLLQRLAEPDLAEGAIVDGFPRTAVQCEILKLFKSKLGDAARFEIVIFSIPESESVARQLQRGRQTLAHNEEVRRTGVGALKEVRKTDTDPEACAVRYRTYVERTETPLKELGGHFPCHAISTLGEIEEVDARILKALFA